MVSDSEYQALVRRVKALERLLHQAVVFNGAVNVSGQLTAGALANGAWTPSFVGTSTAGTFTYTMQSGFYYLLGNLVFVIGNVQISAISVAPVGTMTIAGLPFASVGTTNNLASVTFGVIGNFNYSASALQLTGDIPISNTIIRLIESFDNTANVAVPAANFTNANCHLELEGFYARS